MGRNIQIQLKCESQKAHQPTAGSLWRVGIRPSTLELSSLGVAGGQLHGGMRGIAQPTNGVRRDGNGFASAQVKVQRDVQQLPPITFGHTTLLEYHGSRHLLQRWIAQLQQAQTF